MSAIHIEFSQFGDFDSFDIFRSDSIINTQSLPPPIATNLKSMYYADKTVIEGQGYYYLIRVNKGNQSLLSEQFYAQATAGDLYWGSVKSLLHFDEAAAPSDAKDEKGIVWKLQGSALLSSDRSKLGAKSLFLPALEANYIKSAPTDAFDFLSTDDFTLEFFFNKTDTYGNACILGVLDKARSSRWAFFIRSGATGTPAIYNDSTFIEATDCAITLNQWHHFAYVKKGLNNKLFINGNKVANVNYYCQGYQQAEIYLGQNGLNYESFTGYVDELRITKGVARYQDNFTVPVEPFKNRG